MADDSSSSSAPAPVDASDATISEDDRQGTIDKLIEAVDRGDLTLDDYSERVHDAVRAERQFELDRAMRGIADRPSSAPAPSSGDSHRTILSIFGGGGQTGPWKAPARATVIAFFGGPRLDMRQASLSGPETEITVFAVFGGASVIVSPYVQIDQSGFALFGGNSVHVSDKKIPAHAPTIRCKMYSFFGGTNVTSSI